MEVLVVSAESLHSNQCRRRDSIQNIAPGARRSIYRISDHSQLLKRPGYELDMERVIEHARIRRCFFEINSSPDRLIRIAERGSELARKSDGPRV